MTVGQRIKARREELGMSVIDLARKLGKNRATVYRYEDGFIENLPLEILEPLSTALQTTPAYLMGWEEKIEEDPVGTAQLHVEILMDEEFTDLFDDFKLLDGQQRKLVKDLVHSLVETKKEV